MNTLMHDCPDDPQLWADSAIRQARGWTNSGNVPEFLTAASPDIEPRSIGLAHVASDGAVSGAGAYRSAFSLQSITKLFALGLVLANDGDDLWHRVGYAAPMLAYDSLRTLDDVARRPNPFVNAGAMVVTDRLHVLTGHAASSVCDFIGAQAGTGTVHIDVQVAAAELVRSHRNSALVYALAAAGALSNPPAVVLEQYVSQCAIAATCIDTAGAGLFLARAGRGTDGKQFLPPEQARRLVGLLSLSGTYAASAETMFRIGLPAKSGIGGGIFAVLPGRGTVCATSPGLDEHGTSVAAGRALETFAQHAFTSANNQ